MRYFVIASNQSALAVVFHDHVQSSVYCHSKSASFLAAFDALCAKEGVLGVKEADPDTVLRIVSQGANDYDWVERVLDHLPSNFWEIVDRGDVVNVTTGIDSIILKYLC